MRSVAVVTDSTAYLPTATVAEHGIRVVPLQVVMGGRPYEEGVDVSPGEVADALRSWTPVSTSRPAPAAFSEAYRAAAEAGCDAVVSVHLSARLSGTVEAAEQAAKESPVPVEVVDSRTLGMGLGFAVLAAARCAEAGEDAVTVAGAARACAAGSWAVFYVDTLEHLRRGGRIGAAAALLGSALAVKPLLHLVDGQIQPLEKVRTSSRALARLEELVVSRAGERDLDVAVQHLAAAERAVHLARRLGGRLAGRLAGREEIHVGEVGAVVGAHTGPGMLAVVLAPRFGPRG